MASFLGEELAFCQACKSASSSVDACSSARACSTVSSSFGTGKYFINKKCLHIAFFICNQDVLKFPRDPGIIRFNRIVIYDIYIFGCLVDPYSRSINLMTYLIGCIEKKRINEGEFTALVFRHIFFGKKFDKKSQNVSIRGVSIRGVSIRGVSIRGVSITGVSIRGVSIGGVLIRGVSIKGVSIRSVSIRA